MKRFGRQLRMIRWALIVGGAIAAFYYVLVYRALARERAALDLRLEGVASELFREAPLDSDERIAAARRSAEAVSEMQRKIRSRTELNPVFEHGLNGPFQLVDFEIERETLNDELIQLAKSRKAGIPAIPFEHLPEYTEEMSSPHQLWGQLGVAYHAIVSALEAGVGTIESVDGFEFRQGGEGEMDPLLDEVVFELTLTGSMSKVAVFLKTLPMDRGEMERHGFKTGQLAKPALFIDGLMLRKRPGENLDDVRLDLRVGGFIRRRLE